MDPSDVCASSPSAKQFLTNVACASALLSFIAEPKAKLYNFGKLGSGCRIPEPMARV